MNTIHFSELCLLTEQRKNESAQQTKERLRQLYFTGRTTITYSRNLSGRELYVRNSMKL